MDPKIATKWMEDAFALALAARGTTVPNPAVGCVVLDKSGKLVAKAATSPDGRPHAERKALEQAGAKARGGTLVVTLEPCVAFPGKRTPPCAAAAIVAGIETVIVGAIDPNPRVAGRGLHALRKSGMEVVECPLEGRVPDFYRGFEHFLTTGKPRITVKIAISADGKMTAAAGTRTAITGDESRRFVHGLRAASDAILIGGRSVLADDPELTVRDSPGRSPHRCVLWPRQGLPGDLKVWSASAPVSVFAVSPRPEGLPSNVEWIRLPADSDGRVEWNALLDWFATQGMHDVLVEPGPELLHAFLTHESWDGLWVLQSRTMLPAGVPSDPHGLLPSVSPHQVREFGPDKASFWTALRNLRFPPLS